MDKTDEMSEKKIKAKPSKKLGRFKKMNSHPNRTVFVLRNCSSSSTLSQVVVNIVLSSLCHKKQEKCHRVVTTTSNESNHLMNKQFT